MVRKGIKNGLSSEFDADVERFFALFADNVHRQGTPALPKRYFALLREVFGDDCSVLTVLDAARSAGVQRAVLLLAGRSAALLRRRCGCGARARGERLQVLGAHARRLRTRSDRLFDYGRSKRGTGSFDFKKNWGFEPQPLQYEYLLVKGQACAGA